MAKRPSKYKRCKKCKELVIDPDNCANCENTNPLSASRVRRYNEGKRGNPTLDIQEGNKDL